MKWQLPTFFRNNWTDGWNAEIIHLKVVMFQLQKISWCIQQGCITITLLLENDSYWFFRLVTDLFILFLIFTRSFIWNSIIKNGNDIKFVEGNYINHLLLNTTQSNIFLLLDRLSLKYSLVSNGWFSDEIEKYFLATVPWWTWRLKIHFFISVLIDNKFLNLKFSFHCENPREI